MNAPRIVVIGDALLDIDLIGEASRLCPDAPVPVLDAVTEHIRPGGAALAAYLAALRGADVTLVTPLTDDEPARRLLGLMEGVATVHTVPFSGSTPVKRRIRADRQSLARLDTGGDPATVGPLPDAAVDAMRSADAILISDYGRGAAYSQDVRRLLQSLLRRSPVVWDPHPRGALPVHGVTLVTPNARETAAWLQRCGRLFDADGPAGWTAVFEQADALLHAWHAGAIAVTLGSGGAVLSYGQGAPLMLSAPRVVSGDSCGAGDAFAATATVLLGAGQVIEEAVQEAVAEATTFVADGGAGSIARPPGGAPAAARAERSALRVAEDVHARNGTLVAAGGCFDLLHAGHVACLQAARRLGDALVVCINSDASVRRLKGPSRPVVPAEDRARILLALECVDAVEIFDEDTPVEVLRKLQPAVWTKGGDYAGTELPEERVLTEWGGRCVTLPYVDGRSTSALVRAVAHSASNEHWAGERRTIG